jgi:hypothetical protein
MADSGRLLAELLVALRTVEVNPDWLLLPFAATMTQTPEQVLSLLMMHPVPRWSAWVPFMGWLLEQLDSVPPPLRAEVARLMEIWQDKSPSGSIYRLEVGEAALAWLQELEGRRKWHGV